MTDANTIAGELGDLAPGLGIEILSRRLPKADLHAHLGGSLRPSFAPDSDGRSRSYRGADDFFTALHSLSASFTAREDLTSATVRILEGSVDAGCRHVELSLQLAEFRGSPLDERESIAAVVEAFDIMHDRVGLSGGLILATYRGEDSAAAVRTVRSALDARDVGLPILGIGNDGPLDRPLSEFREAYSLAREEGLRTTVHVDGVEDIDDAFALPLDRIDHGFAMSGRPADLARCADAGIPVTLCLSSNLIMLPGRFPTFAAFPIDEFRAAGINASLHTDDSALFFTDLAQEYRMAARAFAWTPKTTAQVALDSLAAAWITEPNRSRLLAEWTLEAEALVQDPRDPR
ncbi:MULTISPECIES: adenosine deaminase family protein [unclassified Microbacterium]|uniref:adenosine deaminase family protein n=1 Tax=unclassified Microbacterium TaxID=2609290 RepID=UPI003420F161